MRRIYIIVDLSVLRGPHRATHLGNLISAVARTWAVSYRPDISYGYKLYDSSCGDCAVNHYLQRVASELSKFEFHVAIFVSLRPHPSHLSPYTELPQRLHAPTATDLGSDDLALLFSLIDSATDDEFLEGRHLRQRRTSRSAEVPVQGFIRSLQAAISSSYLQKLANTHDDDDDDDDDATAASEGVIIACTPALGDAMSARVFVGATAFEAAGGNLPTVMATLVPPKLQSLASSLALRFSWLTAESTDTNTDTDGYPQSFWSSLSASMSSHLFSPSSTSTTVVPLHQAAQPSLDFHSFTALMGLWPFELPARQDVGGDEAEGVAEVAAVWPCLPTNPSLDPDVLEHLKAVVYCMDRVHGGRNGRNGGEEGRHALKVGRHKYRGTGGLASKRKHNRHGVTGGCEGGGVDEGKMQRGHRLRDKALKQLTASAAAAVDNSNGSGGGGRGGSVPPVDTVPAAAAAATAAAHANANKTSSIEPMTLETAIERISTGLNALVDKTLGDNVTAGGGGSAIPPQPAVAGQTLADAIEGLVHTAFDGVLAHETATVPKAADRMDARDVAVAVGSRATTPAAEFKTKFSAGIPYAEQNAFAWKCAAQLLLRICISVQQQRHMGTNKMFKPTADTNKNKNTARISMHTKTNNMGAVFDPVTFNEILSLHTCISATMQPIILGGRLFFNDVVKSRYTPSLPVDIARLEKAIFGSEEDDELDEDGTVTAVRRNAVSLEESGETPESPEQQQQQQQQRRVEESVGVQEEVKMTVNQHVAHVRGRKPDCAPGGGGGGGEGGGGGHSMRSGDGSGIHGASSGGTAATAGTRRAGGHHVAAADFISRRYNNSRQFNMQTRVPSQNANANVHRLRQMASQGVAPVVASSKARPVGKAHQGAVVGGGGNVKHDKKTNSAMPRAVPDTPLGEKNNKGNTNNDDNIAVRCGNRRQLIFSPIRDPANANTNLNKEDAVPDAIPNTDLRAADAPPNNKNNATTAAAHRHHSLSPIRQPQFKLVGAILPSNDTVTGQGEKDDVDIEMNEAAAVVAVTRPPLQSNWFSGAVVPKNKGGVVPAVAVVPVVAMDPQTNGAEDEEGQQPVGGDGGGEEEEITAAMDERVGPDHEQEQEQEHVVDEGMHATTVNETLTKQTKKCASEEAKALQEQSQQQQQQGEPSTDMRRGSARLPSKSKTTATRKSKRSAKATAISGGAGGGDKHDEVQSPQQPATEKEKVQEQVQVQLQLQLQEQADGNANDVEPQQPRPLPPPILAPEALRPNPPPLAPPLTTPTAARTASILGKRSLVGLAGRTPHTNTKRGRLNSMLPSGSKPRPRAAGAGAGAGAGGAHAPRPPLAPSARLPHQQPTPHPEFQIEDVGSPNKPARMRAARGNDGQAGNANADGSPYADDWGLPSSPPHKRRGGRGGAKRGGGGAKKATAPPAARRGRGVAKKMVAELDAAAEAAEAAAAAAHGEGVATSPAAGLGGPGEESSGESSGEAPASPPSATKGQENKSPKSDGIGVGVGVGKGGLGLRSLSPNEKKTPGGGGDGKGEDSDEEDAAVLQAACNGELSPAQYNASALLEDAEEEKEEERSNKKEKTRGATMTVAARDAATVSLLETTPAMAEDESAGDDEEEEEHGRPPSKTKTNTKSAPKKTKKGSIWTKKRITKKRKLSNKNNNKSEGRQQMHLTKLAAPQQKAAGAAVEGIPTIGDEIRWAIVFPGVPSCVSLHCHISTVVSANKDGRGGWACEVEAQPVDAPGMGILKIVLKSSSMLPWDGAFTTVGQWSRWSGEELQPQAQAVVEEEEDASPIATLGNGIGGGGGLVVPAETARHKAGSRAQKRDSLDSVPVLPETAEKRRAEANEYASPRYLRPVHLDMDGAAGKVVGRRDSLTSSGGCRRSVGLSPAAHAFAAALLGPMYAGTPVQPVSNVEQLMATAADAVFSTPRMMIRPAHG